MNKEKGFTLIELLIVIVVIAVLASVLIVSLVGVRKDVAKRLCRTAISNIENALAAYKTDCGEYPPSGNENLVLYLEKKGPNAPYYPFKKKEKNEQGQWIDHWKMPFVYINPGNFNKHSFDIYSFGPDKEDDKGKSSGYDDRRDDPADDINNWE